MNLTCLACGREVKVEVKVTVVWTAQFLTHISFCLLLKSSTFELHSTISVFRFDNSRPHPIRSSTALFEHLFFHDGE